jgi:hypothetical protein
VPSEKTTAHVQRRSPSTFTIDTCEHTTSRKQYSADLHDGSGVRRQRRLRIGRRLRCELSLLCLLLGECSHGCRRSAVLVLRNDSFCSRCCSCRRLQQRIERVIRKRRASRLQRKANLNSTLGLPRLRKRSRHSSSRSTRRSRRNNRIRQRAHLRQQSRRLQRQRCIQSRSLQQHQFWCWRAISFHIGHSVREEAGACVCG